MKNLVIISSLILNVNVIAQSRLTPPEPERFRTYDVKHIDVKVKIDLNRKEVEGNAKTTISPINNGIIEFETDAVAFRINHIRDYKGNDLKYDYDGQKIKIFTEEIKPGDSLIYEVDYVCNPQRGMHFIYPDEFNPSLPYQVWTQGEAEYNKHWMPLYDYPNDKTTFEISIITDKKYQTLSNGYLNFSSDIEGTNLKEDHWVMDKPNSTYLIMIAVGEFNVKEENYLGIPVQSYAGININPEDVEYTFRNTSEMLNVFSEFFGYAYPWNKYSQIVVEEFIHGGMENTTATVLSKRLIVDEDIEKNYSPESTISHEIGHQWWGDLITCRNWKEFWINESFATYSTSVWKEKKYGNDEYDYDILRNSDDAIRADSVIGRYPILGTYGNLTQNVYDKGSVILNTFRYILGDNFRPALKTFLNENEFDVVETKDFTDALNITTGMNFEQYVEQWISKAGYPVFNVKYSFDKNKKEVRLEVKQVQETDSLTPVFKFPMDIRLKNSAENIIKKIQINTADEIFIIQMNVKPDFVVFDYGNNILDKTYFDKPFSDWKNQIEQSEDAIDRITGLRGLEKFLNNKISGELRVKFSDNESDEAYRIIENVLNIDTFWGVRVEASKILGKSKDPDRAFEILNNSYNIQTNYRIKREIVNSIGALKNNISKEFIKNLLKTESDNYIIAQCISASKYFPKSEIYDVVFPFINIESHRNIIRDNVIEALDSADNGHEDVRIKTAIMNIAFGTDVESILRAKAINSLKKYAGDEDIKEKARRVSEINSFFVKRAAVNLLAASGDKSQIIFLEEIDSRTTDEGIKKIISSAIKKLEGNMQ